MLREIFSDFIKAVISPVQLGMLCIGLLLVIVMVSSCDNTSANPFQKLYYDQIVITDSVRTVLMAQINMVSTVSNRKIDSLKSIEQSLRNQIANFTCDSAAIIRYHYQTAITPYLFIPLNQRLTEIIDSLNQK